MEPVSPYVFEAQLAALRALRAADDIPEGIWWEATPHGITMMVSPDFNHAEIRERIAAQLRQALPDHLRVQNDVAFLTAAPGERTPDLFVVDGQNLPDFRDGHFMSMHSVVFVLEVTSRSTRHTDVADKPGEYAVSGVPVYMIVDRKKPEVLVHHGPTPTGYAHTDRYPLGKDVPLPGPVDFTLDMAFLADFLD